MRVRLRDRQRQGRHRPREQHAACVLGLAETPRDLGKRQLLEGVQQDHLAVGVRQRRQRGVEPLGPLVEDQARQRRPGPRQELGVIADLLVLLGVALLPVVEIGAVVNLALRDAHQPAEQRPAVRPFELVDVLERLEEGRLQDVPRLEACAQAAAHFQPDEREQPGRDALINLPQR